MKKIKTSIISFSHYRGRRLIRHTTSPERRTGQKSSQTVSVLFKFDFLLLSSDVVSLKFGKKFKSATQLPPRRSSLEDPEVEKNMLFSSSGSIWINRYPWVYLGMAHAGARFSSFFLKRYFIIQTYFGTNFVVQDKVTHWIALVHWLKKFLCLV